MARTTAQNVIGTSELVRVHPGKYFVSDDRNITLTTLLGSCVSACLYDPVAGVYGMNHFLLSTRGAQAGPLCTTKAGRYGQHAMELLINEMLSLGARRRHIEGKAFGGANVLDMHAGFDVGKLNVEFIRDHMQVERIPLVAESLGGMVARRIFFRGDDFAVFVRKVSISEKANIVEEERKLKDQKLEAGKAVLWLDPP